MGEARADVAAVGHLEGDANDLLVWRPRGAGEDAIEQMLSHYPINTVEPLRRLADKALELGKYPFN